MKRNILLLIADDLGKMVGCYGDAGACTPNIDALAECGTRFDMAFTSTASCSASRSVIYTGLHAHQNGSYGLNHDHHHFMTFPHVETAPMLLNRAGYLTAIVGKIHVGPEAAYPWGRRYESGTRDIRWVAEKSAGVIAEADSTGAPFFLTVGFVDPHRDASRSGFGNQLVDPEGEDRVDPETVAVPYFLNDLPEVRIELAEYYQSIRRLDRGVGLVIDELKKSGHWDDTLIVFLSDNGAPFLNSKTTLYDAGVQLPLIMRMPQGQRGINNPNLVSYIDLLPTFLDWAGDHGATGERAGRSLLPIIGREELLPGWQTVFGSHTFHEITNYYPTRFIRTPRFKYHRNVAWQLDFPFSGDIYGSLSWEGIRNQPGNIIGQRPLKTYVRRPAEELYDLTSDPAEVHNLAGDSEFAATLKELRTAMENWQRATGDPWLYRDGVSLRAIETHLDNGLQVPDRFDFDPDKPGTA